MDYVIKGLSVFFILVSGNFSDENEAQRDGNIRSDQIQKNKVCWISIKEKYFQDNVRYIHIKSLYQKVHTQIT